MQRLKIAEQEGATLWNEDNQLEGTYSYDSTPIGADALSPGANHNTAFSHNSQLHSHPQLHSQQRQSPSLEVEAKASITDDASLIGNGATSSGSILQADEEVKSMMQFEIVVKDESKDDVFKVTYKPKKTADDVTSHEGTQQVLDRTCVTLNLNPEIDLQEAIPRTNSGIGTWFDAEYTPDSASDAEGSRSFEYEEDRVGREMSREVRRRSSKLTWETMVSIAAEEKSTQAIEGTIGHEGLKREIGKTSEVSRNGEEKLEENKSFAEVNLPEEVKASEEVKESVEVMPFEEVKTPEEAKESEDHSSSGALLKTGNQEATYTQVSGEILNIFEEFKSVEEAKAPLPELTPEIQPMVAKEPEEDQLLQTNPIELSLSSEQAHPIDLQLTLEPTPLTTKPQSSQDVESDLQYDREKLQANLEEELSRCIKVYSPAGTAKSGDVGSSSSLNYEEEPPEPFRSVPQPLQDTTPELSAVKLSIGDFGQSVQELLREGRHDYSSVESLLEKLSPISSRGSLRMPSHPNMHSAVDLLSSELWKRQREGNSSMLSSNRHTARSGDASQYTSQLQLKDLTSMSERTKTDLLDDFRIASKCINLKTIKVITSQAMQVAPADIVVELGMGLMYICDFDIPPFNQKEAVMRFYSKPGFVVQKVRGLEQGIQQLTVPSSAMQKLAGILADLTENKVRARDNSGAAHIIHYFLVKALALFQHCQAKLTVPRLELNKLSYSSMPVTPKNRLGGPLTPGNYTAKSFATTPSKPTNRTKLNLANKLEKSKGTSLQPSSRSRSKPSISQKSPKTAPLRPEEIEIPSDLTAAEAFDSGNPKLIEKFLKKQQHDLVHLQGYRKKAEWNCMRRHKMKLATADAQAQAVEIEYAAKLSQKQHQLAHENQTRETKVIHDTLKQKADYLRTHKKVVDLRSKPYYSRSGNFKVNTEDEDGGLSSEGKLMNAYEDMIQQKEKISSMRFAYLEIQDQKRAEEALLNKFFR